MHLQNEGIMRDYTRMPQHLWYKISNVYLRILVQWDALMLSWQELNFPYL